jgi:hypothetical protein
MFHIELFNSEFRNQIIVTQFFPVSCHSALWAEWQDCFVLLCACAKSAKQGLAIGKSGLVDYKLKIVWDTPRDRFKLPDKTAK